MLEELDYVSDGTSYLIKGDADLSQFLIMNRSIVSGRGSNTKGDRTMIQRGSASSSKRNSAQGDLSKLLGAAE